MPTLPIIGRDGRTKNAEGVTGSSVMEIIRDAVRHLLALCGGDCRCARCHVHVEGGVDAGPPGADEDDLLDSSEHHAAGSRLSCQIVFADALDGLMVRIAPED